MIKNFSFSNPVLIFGLPLLLILSMIALVNSSAFLSNPQGLSVGVTLDLVLTLPLLYFLLIRKTDIAKITVVSVFGLGVVTASFLLPEGNQTILDAAKFYVLPLVEFGIFAFLFIKIRTGWKSAKAASAETPDFYEALKIAVNETLPKHVAPIFITEIAVPYYAFFNWKNRPLRENEFSYHRRNGIREALGAFSFIIIIETFAVHLAVEPYYHTFAWILTFLSLYTGLQVFALIRSLPKRPIVIDDHAITFRFGFMGEVAVKIDDIEEIEFTRKAYEDGKGIEKLSPLGDLDSHNMFVHLKNEYTLNSLYGIKKKFTTLALHLDDKEGFKAQVENARKNLR